jgi:hypothetical protein
MKTSFNWIGGAIISLLVVAFLSVAFLFLPALIGKNTSKEVDDMLGI